MLLDGPDSAREKIMEVEKTVLEGGLFGYRFFYPPMRVGEYDVYLNRPVVAYLPAGGNEVDIKADLLYGYMTGYRKNDSRNAAPCGDVAPDVEKGALHFIPE